MAEQNASTYTVIGMTCGHCEMSVREELEEIPGVSDVVANHESGVVTFTSDRPVSREQVDAAVTEAGYQLA
ncbi:MULTISPECIES: heavy-metal-associated domain-containing protein [Dermacoccus]|uniref:heavy-metal-associated domain-containing protein n=1 Tax=Dermacoccus TaxID=57495 RepID=UPI00093CE428|nr:MULTISPECIES: heavy-metal-associated domain-containing protein [Dermacoccus]MBO1759680.1 heavy-metal-associated domain-containing protein [Dermacoccus sp. NHGro5]MCG7428605.1 heavy-metal-associated domain-containing protein [Dermacoccus nishinomiyaensis]